MSNAPEGVHKLTRAQRRVLAHIEMCCDSRERLVESNSRTAEATGLSAPGVAGAIARLNDLGLIWTTPGTPIHPSEHVLLRRGAVLPERKRITRAACAACAGGRS